MKFKKICIKDLIDFVESDFYKNCDFVPISKLRAISQASNPRANPEDIALIVAIDNEEKIAGFIGALPEKIPSLPHIKVAWNSCWYVPEGNGKYAMPLFYHFMAAYNGNVMMRDMTEHTKKLLLQTGRFSIVKELKGMRGYLSLNLHEKLTRHYSFFRYFKFLLRIFDYLFDNILGFFRNIKLKKQPRFLTEYIDVIDKEANDFIRKHNRSDITQRGTEELSWIFQNKWITTTPDENQHLIQKKYFFSLIKNQFENKFIKLYNKNELAAVLFLNTINNELRVPYLFADKQHISLVSDFLAALMVKNKYKSFISFNSNLNHFIFKKPSLFIMKREIEKDFVVSNSLDKEKLNQLIFQDGEGDFVFV